MKIKKILWQQRRDFEAIFECEHCEYEYMRKGYDDSYFHNTVIPNEMVCTQCGKKSPEDYRPLDTKYPDGYQI